MPQAYEDARKHLARVKRALVQYEYGRGNDTELSESLNELIYFLSSHTALFKYDKTQHALQYGINALISYYRGEGPDDISIFLQNYGNMKTNNVVSPEACTDENEIAKEGFSLLAEIVDKAIQETQVRTFFGPPVAGLPLGVRLISYTRHPLIVALLGALSGAMASIIIEVST